MKLAVILLLLVAFAVLCSCTEQEPKHEKHAAEKAGTGTHTSHKKGKKYNTQKHAKKSGKKTKYDEEKSAKGQSGSIVHKIDDEEEKGKKTKYFDEGGHRVYKKAGEQSAYAGYFNDGKHQKKTRFSKGFREKYHKDEHKKHDSFYSKGFKSGDFEVFGSKGSQYGLHQQEEEGHGKHGSRKSVDKHAKSGKKLGGHNKHEDTGHRDEKGIKTHYNKNTKWAKKGPKSYKGKKIIHSSSN